MTAAMMPLMASALTTTTTTTIKREDQGAGAHAQSPLGAALSPERQPTPGQGHRTPTGGGG